MSAPPVEPRTASLSDVGRRRPSNQDHCGEFFGPEGARLLICCDGMGGHQGGETASQLAVETIGEVISAGGEAPDDLLRHAFEEANRRIRIRADQDPSLSGMGTTGVALLLKADGSAWIAHVGDSRGYRVRGGAVERLTQDHSVVAEQVRQGLLTAEEAARLPHNELSRAIGAGPQIEVDLAPLDARDGDRFLLCSDGLWNLVSEAEIAATLVREDPEQAVKRLIGLANERGGNDNVTVQVLALGVAPPLADSTWDATDPWRPGPEREDITTVMARGEETLDQTWARTVALARERRDRAMRLAAAAAALVTLLLLGALAWLYLFSTPDTPAPPTAIGESGASQEDPPAVGAGGDPP